MAAHERHAVPEGHAKPGPLTDFSRKPLQIKSGCFNLAIMYKTRNLTTKLRQLAAAFPAVALTGARQVGKTTLLRHLFPDHDYVVFDPTQDLENARQDPDLFFLNHPHPILLDEIQYAPELVSAIKRQIDAHPDRRGYYLITGSQQWQVMSHLAESLAGRVALLELSGFSLTELEGTPNGWLDAWLTSPEGFLDRFHPPSLYPAHLSEWIWRGTLPKVQELPLSLVPDFWNSYHRTYVERDARLAGNVQDWQEFGRFVRLLSALTAQEINYSQLGREIGLTPPTARRWLRILEATYQWHELPALTNNLVKRISSRPKGHWGESGLACFHAQISSPQSLTGHPLYGALFETAMVNDLIKQAAMLPLKPSCHHWRSAGGAEVDLVMDRDGTLHPFEIKLTTQPTKRHASGLEAFRATHPNAGPGALICAVPAPRWITPHVLAIPWNLSTGTNPPD
ncbi:ATP-binding protein [Ferrovum sp.]|uniref:ATP-binding protein n=1 Tax=Ferrovum sp. TaxID=2609467 RepID=UPI00261C29A3|nr:ATP-binding protein [Ferrovum sp.]